MGCVIFLNEIVAEIEQEKQYRVLWVSPYLVYGYWIRMDDNKMPEKFEYNLLEKGLASGRFEKKEQISMETSDMDISESSKMRRMNYGRHYKVRLHMNLIFMTENAGKNYCRNRLKSWGHRITICTVTL